MKMLNCVCGKPAIHIKIERRKERRGNTTFTFAAEHTVECSQKCGQCVRGETAKETKTTWNSRMRAAGVAA